MSSVLAINGTTVNRFTAHVVINRLTLSAEGSDTLEFTQTPTVLPGTYRQGQSCTLTVDGTLRFSGVIVSLHPSGMCHGPISVGYRAMGLSWMANTLFVTAADGSGTMTFNRPTTDPNYIASQSALNVGQILTQLYNVHATQLSAIGVTSFVSGDLANLTVVPPDPVILSGRLWNAATGLVSQWHNKYGSWITPDGVIHHQNMLTLPTNTLTLDSDPITLDSISEDFSECFTQVVIRGQDDIQGAYLSLVDLTLVPAWTSAMQTAWNYTSFIQPPGAYETGTISSMSSTTLSVTATNPIPIGYSTTTHWSLLKAEVWAYNPIATGITFQEQRRITSITVPSGNTYTLTVDTPFNNSGYTNYQIRGLANFQSNTSLTQVWRKFNINNTYVSQHLMQRFSHSVPWTGTDGVLVETLTGMSDVCFTQAGQYIEWPMSFTIVPYGTGVFTTQASVTATVSGGAVTGFTGLSGGTGYPPSSTEISVAIFGVGSGATAKATSNASGVITSITLGVGGTGYSSAPTVQIGISNGYVLFDQPICCAYSSQASLNTGGAAIISPTDVKVLVPYSLGPITTQAPSSGYQGTAYSVNGVQRTWPVDCPQWKDYADKANYTTLAQEKLDCVKNAIIDGTVTYWGKYVTALTLGKSVNIASSMVTTGYESIAAPIKTVVLDYCDSGGAAIFKTSMSFSTRLKAFSGDRLYQHAGYGSQRAIGGAGFGHAAQMRAIDFSGGAMGAFESAGQDDRSGAGIGMDPSGLSAGKGRAKKSTRTPTSTPDQGDTTDANMDFYDEVMDAGPDAQSQRRDRAASHGSLREARGIPDAEPDDPIDMSEQGPDPTGLEGLADADPARTRRRQRAIDDGQG